MLLTNTKIHLLGKCSFRRGILAQEEGQDVTNEGSRETREGEQGRNPQHPGGWGGIIRRRGRNRGQEPGKDVGVEPRTWAAPGRDDDMRRHGRSVAPSEGIF
jgi:hypothetical protein